MVEIHHFALWARECRSGVDIGYYHAQPFYTPPRYASEAQAPYTSDDELIAHRIGVAVSALERDDPDRANLLKAYYGAYAGAPDERQERMKPFAKIPARERRRQVSEAQSFVKAYVRGIYDTIDSIDSGAANT